MFLILSLVYSCLQNMNAAPLQLQVYLNIFKVQFDVSFSSIPVPAGRSRYEPSSRVRERRRRGRSPLPQIRFSGFSLFPFPVQSYSYSLHLLPSQSLHPSSISFSSVSPTPNSPALSPISSPSPPSPLHPPVFSPCFFVSALPPPI